MIGTERTVPEQLAYVDYHLLVTEEAEITCLNSKGEWAIEREEWNDRGDESTETERKQSVETIGIRQELRGPPFLFQHKDPTMVEHFDAAHWASLYKGARSLEWFIDAKKRF